MVRLTDDVLLRALGEMRQTLDARAPANRIAGLYHTGKIEVENLRIAIPVELEKLDVVSDWPTTVVSSYHDRMAFLGWRDQGRYGMQDVATLTNVETTLWEATLDSYVCGVGLTAIDRTADGMWKSHSIHPTQGTLLWDAQEQRPTYGFRRRVLADGTEQEILYAPYYTFYLEYTGALASDTAHPVVQDVVYHGMPVPLMGRLRNQLRSSQWYGRSLLTPAVRYYTQAAARTLMGMEYNREFYTAPKYHVSNATPDVFTESENPSPREKIRAGWKATTGSVLTLPPPEQGEPEMKIGQFQANPPDPYVAQLRTYSQLMGSATGIPVAYLGFSTENPPSGDAIRAWLERLVRGCSAQQRLVAPDVRMLGWLLHSLNNDPTPWSEFATTVRERWENPATPTLSSDADAVSKLVDSNIVDAQSDWVYDRIQVPEEDRAGMRTGSRSEIRDLIRTRIEGQADPADADTAARLASLQGESEQ